MRKYLLSLILFLGLLIYANCIFAFEEPPYMSVEKPTPTATKTICTSGCDYSSFSAANKAAQPGWFFKVKAGEYSFFNWTASGTAGNEIVIEPYGDGDVIIGGDGSGTYINNASYVIFDGGENRELVWDGTNITSGKYNINLGYDEASAPDHITISRIKSINNQVGIKTYASSVNLRITGDYNKIYNCIIQDAFGAGIYSRGGNYQEIRNNIISSNGGAGIQYNPHEDGYKSTENIIAGNVIYENGIDACSFSYCYAGVALLSNTNDLGTVYVRNNYLWGNGGTTRGAFYIEDTAADSTIYLDNNTIYNNNEGLEIGDKPIVYLRNNIIYNTGASKIGSNVLDSNNYTGDPDFASTSVDSEKYLKLSPLSPVINQGTDLSGIFKEDYFGGIRPKYSKEDKDVDADFDIGAHEYIVDQPKNFKLMSIE